MKRFPHLQQTTNQFPYDNTRVYSQYVNTFDYQRWESKTTLKPCSVRWTIDSNDRVKWDTDAERDKYFDDLTAKTYTLDSGLNIIPGESVRLPIPYQAMQFANYLAVSIPDMPDNTQLDYSDAHITRLYYFVLDTRRINASVTECILAIDYWTTYINSVNISRIMVERGHVAQSFETVDTYLAAPLTNNIGLTALEPDAPQSPVMVAHNKFIPLAKNINLWLIFAVKCTYTQFTALSEVGTSTVSTPPDYADTSDYWGYQYTVNDYYWGDVPNMSNISTPTTSGISADNTRPNGYTIIGLPANIAFLDGFFNKITEKLPQAWNLINSCYIVPRGYINPVSQKSLIGFTIYRIEASLTTLLSNINLTVEQFGYDDRYKALAKLYTAPYAWLSVTDETGAETIIRVEDTTGDFNIMRRVSIAYPYLNVETFFTGVHGSGKQTYTWYNLYNTGISTDIPDSAFFDLRKHDIPVFTLMIDNSIQFINDNDSTFRRQARENAINAYHISTRGTNTGLNTATASADTGLTNTTASADTGLTNTTASADNAVANTKIQTDTNTANNTRNNTAATDTQNLSVAKIDNDYTTGRQKLINDVIADQTLSGLAANASNDTRAGTTVASIVGQSAAIGVSAALSGGSLGAAALAGAAISAATTGYSAGIVIDNNEQLIASQNAMIATKADYANNANRDYRNHATDLIKGTTSVNIDLGKDITANNNTASTNITANNRNTATANAQRSRGTNVANAQRSRDTSVTNAIKSRDNGIYAAKTTLEQTQANYTAKIQDLKRSKPAIIANNDGDALPDIYGTRGIQIRVMTQSPDIIRRCGDNFLRYGYTFHENVETPELNIKANFTFWRGDAMVYAINAPTRAVDDIKTLFNEGVTIWRNPDKIGSSIYDNE